MVIPSASCSRSQGDWRPTGGYTALNKITRPDNYPNLHIQAFTYNLHGAQIFLRLDIDSIIFL